MNTNQTIQYLAKRLQQLVCEKAGEQGPSIKELEELLCSFVDEHGISMVKEDDDKKTPALFKRKEAAVEISKRMRELAGIPHKGNYV